VLTHALQRKPCFPQHFPKLPISWHGFTTPKFSAEPPRCPT
jgi:hypothetical protein